MIQATFGQRLDRWVLRKGFAVSMPLLALRLIEARRALTQGVGLGSASVRGAANDFIPADLGYRAFGPELFPETPELIHSCQAIFEAHQSELSDTDQFNKKYFFNIASAEDLKNHPVLMAYALRPEMMEIISGYLPNPRLNSIGVYYSEVNDSVAGSQLFHVDGDCLKQMKCFVNVWGVDEGTGPFTFIPASATNRTLRNRGLIKDLSDNDVDQATGSVPYIRATGPAGSGVFCDTSSCLHQGSRARERPRLVFMIQFVSRPDALLDRKSEGRRKGGHIMVNRDLLKLLKFHDPRNLQMVD
jgi:hypothetical protein